MSGGYYQFQHQNATLSYLKAGSGPEPLVLFHGFGQDHSAFKPIIEKLGENFTFFSFDLFFHGKSTWLLNDNPLSKEHWATILNSFLEENNIKKFSLMGFSLGGKFALASMEAFPTRVNSLYLLAPDGIKTSTWYSLATYPIALRQLFKSMIQKPARFHSLVALAKTIRLADKGLIRFAQSQMNTEENRRRVYYSWVVFSLLKFDTSAIASIVNDNQIHLHIIVGKFDKVITSKNMNRLLSKLKICDLKVIEAGHNNLITESVKVVRSIASKRQ